MTALGIGIGNNAAHETGHQLHVPYMDCPISGGAYACPEDEIYQQQFGGRQEWAYGNEAGHPIHWSREGACAIYKFLLGSVPKGFPCQ